MNDDRTPEVEAEDIAERAGSAAPQCADGYTKIANELFEAIIAAPLNQQALRVLLAIIRKTYGFNKKADDIGLSQIVKMTGIDKSDVSRAVNALVEAKVILRTAGNFGHKLSINKHYRQWQLGKSQPPKTVGKIPTPPVGKIPTPPVGKIPTTKDNLSKDNLPKESKPLCKPACTPEQQANFDTFWKFWPKRKQKADALKAFKQLNPDNDLLSTMLASITLAKQSTDWIKAGGQFIPLPATWLRGRMWEDEIKPAIGSFSTEQQVFIDTFNENIGSKCLHVAEWSQLIEDRVTVAMAGSWTMEKWGAYWRYVRDRCQFKGNVSFEWLLNRDNLVRVMRGEFEGD